MRFADKVGLVTGGGMGIGEACAKRLASEGATMVIADIDATNGERVVEEIAASGGSASFRAVDVTDERAIVELVEYAVDTFGGLHLAVNNAGIGCTPTRFHEHPVETWDKLFALNTRGVMLCMRAEIAYMIDHGGGNIVNVASGAGLKPAYGMAPYVASKYAVVGMTRNAALDYATYGIRVNAVAPGPILTPAMMSFPEEQRNEWASPVPMKRFGAAQEVAASVAFLLSDDASYTTSVVLEVDGGHLQG